MPLVGEWVSWTRVRNMLQICRESHPQCHSNNTNKSLPVGFRVIDVARRCLTEQRNCRFVALSYVWGSNAERSTIAYTHTMQDLMVDASLSSDRLPRTIEDALTICTRLQERFLWVDRLCIVQDDAQDKLRQINAMDTIYSTAHFVIIAGHGNGAGYGIPGVSRGRPHFASQQKVALPGLAAVNIVRDREQDPDAVWRTRGWTYQEAVLARRRLYFSNSQVQFECQQSLLHEDEYNGGSRLDPVNQMSPTDRSAFETYTYHISKYSFRSLTFQKDAYAAFTGITNTLFGVNTTRFGLPLEHFDRALHWHSALDGRTLSSREYDGVCFPTWSWFSVMRQPPAHVFHHDVSFHGALTAWHSYDGSELSPIKDRPDDTDLLDWRSYMAIACSEGCVSGWDVLLPQVSWTELRTAFDQRWPDYSAFYQNLTKSMADLQEDVVSLVEETPGSIACRTRCADFGLKDDGKGRWLALSIVDSQGQVVGKICGQTRELRATPAIEENSTFEFIALSLAGVPALQSPREPRGYSGIPGSPMDIEPTVVVMLIGRQGRVAYRKALGWIYLKHWAASPGQWKTIILV
ncbi:HET-domain-containing protein [Ophiobolus disseminans]|uniref:HET-domain-containing protein n=1 Tax=Ophiobolus disseminans TaxID=1469910 RepID=A0A6A6ZQ39_9PLEO|nr:HET-domain-containing protein [Ophiobolus disseminans]